MNETKTIEKIINSKDIIIYGAKILSLSFYKLLLKYNSNITVKCFTVTDNKEGTNEVDGIPVCLITDIQELKNNLVVVATNKQHHAGIKQTLDTYGFENVIYVTAEMEEILMKNYMRNKEFHVLEDEIKDAKESEKNSLEIFMVKSQVDKELQEKYEIPEWVTPIQAGKVLTENKTCEITDDIGENISSKNKNYCELTAMYWAWKNAKTPYVGLCHYRRHFDLTKEVVDKILESGIDAILPYPIISVPSAYTHHTHFVPEKDFEAVVRVLREKYPDYYEAAQRIYSEELFYMCNMWIMKNEHMQEYCTWLFGILEEVEKICEPEGTHRQDRYMGYLAESLTALYFLYNKNNLKIAHTKIKMLV